MESSLQGKVVCCLSNGTGSDTLYHCFTRNFCALGLVGIFLITKGERYMIRSVSMGVIDIKDFVKNSADGNYKQIIGQSDIVFGSDGTEWGTDYARSKNKEVITYFERDLAGSDGEILAIFNK